MVQNNLCPGGRGGLSYTQGGLTYTWMAPAQTGVTLIGEGGVIIGTGSSDISPGYWAVGSVNDLGFFGQLNAYASDAFDALRNWVANQLTPPPGVSLGIIPPQALGLIHSPEVIEANPNFPGLNQLSTEELVNSLAPGAKEPLTLGPGGSVLQGNTRVYILMQRGYDVNSLPTTPYAPSPLDGVPQ